MSSNVDRSPVHLDATECEACGKPYELTPRGGVYSIAVGDHDRPSGTADFALCPSCALTLADEIAHGLPDDYLDVLVATIQRRAARRAEREGVAS